MKLDEGDCGVMEAALDWLWLKWCCSGGMYGMEAALAWWWWLWLDGGCFLMAIKERMLLLRESDCCARLVVAAVLG